MRRAQDSIRGRPPRAGSVIDTTGEAVGEARRRVRVDDEAEASAEELEPDAPDAEERVSVRRRDPP